MTEYERVMTLIMGWMYVEDREWGRLGLRRERGRSCRLMGE